MATETIKVEIDFSDSLKEFILSLVYPVTPLTDEDMEILSQPECIAQLEGQLSMDDVLEPVSPSEITLEMIMELAKPYGEDEVMKPKFQSVIHEYADCARNVNPAHYPEIYKRFQEIINAQ